jgi:hypothetical protein
MKGKRISPAAKLPAPSVNATLGPGAFNNEPIVGDDDEPAVRAG